MEYRIVDKKEYVVSDWSGGKTSQFAIFPEDSSVGAQDFVWRISSATVEDEQTTFTSFPGYSRFITPLSGEMILTFGTQKTCKAEPLQIVEFDGEAQTVSFGKAIDYNLIASQKALSRMEHFKLSGARKIVSPINTDLMEDCAYGVYCCGEYAVVSIDDETVMLKGGQQLIITGRVCENLIVGVMGDGDAICFQVCYGRKETVDEDEHKKKKPAPTGEDVKLAARIYMSDFRGARYVSRFRKTYWFDNELFHSIQRLNRTYITLLVCIAGMVASVLVGYSLMGTTGMIILICGWLAIDWIVLNLLIYVLWLPRPIRDHVILRREMTEEDKRIEAKQLAENPRLEKLLNKYKPIEQRSKKNNDRWSM